MADEYYLVRRDDTDGSVIELTPLPADTIIGPVPHDLRVRANADPTLRAIRFGTDDEAREAYDLLINTVATLTTENSKLRPMEQRARFAAVNPLSSEVERATGLAILGRPSA
jgi:hypothetical protein